jgi:viroplasmin and RNaseH domain-containing protein
VRVGVRPGVYGSNAEAQAQVQRVPGAQYRGFNCQVDAEAFVAGGRSVAATGAVKRRRPED